MFALLIRFAEWVVLLFGTASTHPGKSSFSRAPRPSGRSEVVSGHGAVRAERRVKAEGRRKAGRRRAGKIEEGRREGRRRARVERAGVVIMLGRVMEVFADGLGG